LESRLVSVRGNQGRSWEPTFCFVYDPAPGHSVMISSLASALLLDTNAKATPEKVVPCGSQHCGTAGGGESTHKIDTDDKLGLALSSTFYLDGVVSCDVRCWRTAHRRSLLLVSSRLAVLWWSWRTTLLHWLPAHWNWVMLLLLRRVLSPRTGVDRRGSTHHLRRRGTRIHSHLRTRRAISKLPWRTGSWLIALGVTGRPTASTGIHLG
jgi:hypothetical protein